MPKRLASLESCAAFLTSLPAVASRLILLGFLRLVNTFIALNRSFCSLLSAFAAVCNARNPTLDFHVAHCCTCTASSPNCDVDETQKQGETTQKRERGCFSPWIDGEFFLQKKKKNQNQMCFATCATMPDVVTLLTRKRQYSRSCRAFGIFCLNQNMGPRSGRAVRVKAVVDKNLAAPPFSCCSWIASSLMDYFKVSPSIPFPHSLFFFFIV